MISTGVARVLLEPGQDVEAASAPVAPERVGLVGDVLELLEHEPGHDQRAVQEARFDDSTSRPSMMALVSTTICGRRRLRVAVGRAAGGRGPIASAASSRSSRLATVRPIMPEPQDDRDPSGSQSPAGPRTWRAAGPAAGPAAGRGAGPTTAATNSAVDSSWTRSISQPAGSTVRYGRTA